MRLVDTTPLYKIYIFSDKTRGSLIAISNNNNYLVVIAYIPIEKEAIENFAKLNKMVITYDVPNVLQEVVNNVASYLD